MRRLAPLALCALLTATPALSEVPVPPAAVPATEGTQALRTAVAQCWNVATLSPGAMAVRVTVGLDVDAAGKPVLDSIQLVWPRGDNDMDAQQMYETARRAIVRCGQDGLPLPAALQGRPQRLELTFDATGVFR